MRVSQAEGSDAGRSHAHWRKPAVWQLIHDNIYTHRAPKEQDEDDIMICHCRPCYAGGVGCGPDCLNRVLNMECVPVRHRRFGSLYFHACGAKQLRWSCASPPEETRTERGFRTECHVSLLCLASCGVSRQESLRCPVTRVASALAQADSQLSLAALHFLMLALLRAHLHVPKQAGRQASAQRRCCFER